MNILAIEPTTTNKGEVEIIVIKDNQVVTTTNKEKDKIIVIKDNQVVTKYNNTFIERFMINYPNWDIYMLIIIIICCIIICCIIYLRYS